jgi:hypothetical protein
VRCLPVRVVEEYSPSQETRDGQIAFCTGWHTGRREPRGSTALLHSAHTLRYICSMHYRRSSPNPTRLVLRIVAAAGAGAVVSACSSGSGQGSLPCGGVCGSVGIAQPDASDDGGGTESVGSVANFADASGDGDAELPCGTGVCGSIVSPPSDAGDASTIILGLVVRPEGGSDQ